MQKNTFLFGWGGNWKSEWQRMPFRYNLFFSLTLLVGFLLFSTKFLVYCEARKGNIINDLLLERMPGMDFSGWIFFLIYSCLLLGFCHVSRFPHRLVIAFYVYTLVLIFRMLTIYLFPLEAPSGIIVLRDPFVEYFTGAGNPLEKDLFFSGHTATMCIIYFLAKNKWLKFYFLGSTIAVAMMLLFQHVHYTMDVIGAPFFVLAGYYLVLKLYRQSGRPAFRNILKTASRVFSIL